MARARSILAIGVMTGNSLDAADLVLTNFGEDGSITDLKSHSVEFPNGFADGFRRFRSEVSHARGKIAEAVDRFDEFHDLHNDYLRLIAEAVTALIAKAKVDPELSKTYDLAKIDLIGFHGQTCAHLPPSMAKTRGHKNVYTVQVGDGQKLADLTGITVVYDFRSDDMMNGGEGAPLAPMHHAHLGEHAKRVGQYPIAFCNGGNTGNITLLTTDQGDDLVQGWDTGPFNHYSDRLIRHETGMPFDKGGLIGKKGKIDKKLLEALFEKSAITALGDNYFELPPPKSCDPEWYLQIPELSISGISFEDRLRTVQYFSAYVFVHSLTLLPESVVLPRYFALCGGGWKNPNIMEHFVDLLRGKFKANPVLDDHISAFESLSERFGMGNQIVIEPAQFFGYDGAAMEARLMADAAFCRIAGKPFTTRSITGVESDTVLGIIRFPNADINKATLNLRAWIDDKRSLNLTYDDPKNFDSRWSRASAGWFEKLVAAQPH
jgi:anhydro-N-acetylmuramic acid kinase